MICKTARATKARTFIALIVTFLLGATTAHAEKRVALVLGNSAYQNVARLQNPANDANAIAQLLSKAGFDIVTARTDLGNLEFKRALRDFTDAAAQSDIALVFFAGHGIEVKGMNYLIPIDAKLARDYDAEDETVSLNRIIDAIEPAKKLRVIILDACRDNPFNTEMKRMVATRAVASGLARVEPAISNFLIAYGAKHGSTADDGNGEHSPFTSALLNHLTEPGVEISKAFRRVRDEVLRNTNNRQEPFVYSSLGGEDIALVPAREQRAVETAPTDPNAGLRRDYELAERVGTKQAWDFFLGAHGSGFYADLAAAQRSKILAAEQAQAEAAAAKIRADAAARASTEAKEVDRSKALVEAQRAQVDAMEKERSALAAEHAKVEAAEKARAEAAKAFEATRAELEKLKAEFAKAQSEAARSGNVQVATAPSNPAPETPKASGPSDLTRALQTELRRVGCNTGAIDGEWSANARRALDNFNRHAGMKLETKVASLDALDAVKAKESRVCPLTCEHGYRAQGEACVAIACKAGFFVNDDNECEKKEDKTKAAARPTRSNTQSTETDKPKAAAKPGASPSSAVACNNSGCSAVPANCKVQQVKCYSGMCDKVVCP